MSYQHDSNLDQIDFNQEKEQSEPMDFQFILVFRKKLYENLENEDESIPEIPSFDQLEHEYNASGPVAALPMLRSNVTYRPLTPEERERFIEKLKKLE